MNEIQASPLDTDFQRSSQSKAIKESSDNSYCLESSWNKIGLRLENDYIYRIAESRISHLSLRRHEETHRIKWYSSIFNETLSIL